jgi:CheY-like chemotaxis protein
MGLGLAIVRHLIELHGGTVTADSHGENQGSTFTISLPLAAVTGSTLPSTTELEKADEADGLLNGIRILLVEDEPDARELIALTLRRSGADVEAVETAANALRRLQVFTPDLLLSDIGLPIESGYDLIRRIRALPSALNKLPAIALTAFATDKDRQMSISAGFHEHLAKPVEPRRLIETIKSLVNGKS